MPGSLTLVIVAAVFVLVWLFVFMGIWASRFVKVGPNQALIVSGRKNPLPDGRLVGFRIVKGGGTFVWPVIEKVEVLSLEVFTLEIPNSKVSTKGGAAVEADCMAQVKIKSDDASLIAATEHFLSKTPEEIKKIVQPILETHLSHVLATASIQEISQNPAACAALVQTAATKDLSRLGLETINFTIRNARAA
jgi:flotillin